MSPVLTQHVSQPITLDEQTQKMKQHLLQDIRRSAYVYRVDCGGCNACEIEIFAAITPVFDAERFGIKVVSSPRHADILLFTGAVTRAMRMPALRAYESAPDHKICVSYGACGVGGGIFHDLYSVWRGSDTIVPIDVWIPGCPPTPAATIHGFAVALGLLKDGYHVVLTGRRPEPLAAVAEAGLDVARAKAIAGDDYVVLVADVYGADNRPKDSAEAGRISATLRNDPVLLRERALKAVEVLQAQAGKAISCKASAMKSGLVGTRFMDTMGRLAAVGHAPEQYSFVHQGHVEQSGALAHLAA